jgi:radical SAM protein with 4Fe4S-binding SPASM domain
MANIIISEACNLKCPFCFAGEYLDAAYHKSDFLSLEVFEERLDFLERSGIQEIRLMGGEPTLHPDFVELIERAYRRQKHIVVFSHGLIPEHALNCLESFPPETCTVLVNTNATRHTNGPDDAELAQRYSTIKRLGRRVLLGFTIYTPVFEMGFLLDMIQNTECKKQIRVGLAQAIPNARNTYLHPNQYPAVGSKLTRFVRRAAGMNINLELDCGFVRCMFSASELDTLQTCGTKFESHCNPILDIGLDGRIIHCFPLTGQVEMPADRSMNADDMRQILAAGTRMYRAAGIYRECSDCPFKLNNVCSGGCLASTLLRFHEAAVRIQIPETVLYDDR